MAKAAKRIEDLDEDSPARRGVLKRDDAIATRELVDGLYHESQPWRAHIKKMDDLFYSSFAISWPDNLPMPPTPTPTGIAAQQERLLLGMLLGEMPKAGLISPTSNLKKLDRIEELEAASNRVWDILEQQNQRVWAPTVQSVCRYGLGWMKLVNVPKRLAEGSGIPTRGDLDKEGKPKYGKASDYMDARSEYIQALGTPSGKFPMLWTHRPTGSVLHMEGQDEQLLCVVDSEEVYVLEVLHNERYAASLPGMVKVVRELSEGRTSLARLKVRMVTVETQDLCTVWMQRSLAEPSTDDPFASTQRQFNEGYSDGEIADQYPIDGPRYVMMTGLTRSSRSQWDGKYVGICTDMADHIIRLDSMQSYSAYLQQLFVFPPVVLEYDGQYNPNMPEARPTNSPGNTAPTFDMTPGFMNKSVLPYGVKARFFTPEQNPDFLAMMDRMRRDTMLLGTPESVMESVGTGYEYNSVLNTSMAANMPVKKGVAQGFQKLVLLFHRNARELGEDLPLLAPEGEGATWRWVRQDVLKDHSLNIQVEVIYEIKRPENEAQALQNYMTATTPGPNQAYDKKRARRKYLQEEEHEGIEKDIRVEQVLASPDWMKFLQDQAISEAGLLDQQEKAKQEAAVALDQLLAMTPGAADLLAEQALANPDMPGFGAAQQYAGMRADPEQTGLQTATPPAQPDPRMSPAPARTGGRAAGQGQSPGGPRRQGGVSP